GIITEVDAHNPYMEKIKSSYLIINNDTCVIELAKTAGIELIKDRGNPLLTSTYGVGEQIRDGLLKGYKHFYIGLGGSATNDGGCGILSALGVKFLNKFGYEFIPTGRTLHLIYDIILDSILSQAKDASFEIFTDVKNPLTGENGATMVYAKQKGASLEMLSVLESNMCFLERLIQNKFGCNTAFEGAGAAGGASIAFHCFLNSKFSNGIDAILKIIKIDDLIKDASLIISGEGKLDSQSFQGKVIDGIAKKAFQFHIPFICICGQIQDIVKNNYPLGLTEAYSLMTESMTLEDALHNTKYNLEQKVKEIINQYL
ncbi:MAG: glycerate kinase, partial [Bacilli bacterium]